MRQGPTFCAAHSCSRRMGTHRARPRCLKTLRRWHEGSSPADVKHEVPMYAQWAACVCVLALSFYFLHYCRDFR